MDDRFGQGVILFREIRRRLIAMVPPVIFLAITWYFGWGALHGARGLEAQDAERAQLAKAQQDFAVVDAARARWETQVAALGGPRIAPDMLDEQLRQVLSMADPADLVVKFPADAAK